MADLEFGLRLTADGSAFVGSVRIAREEVEKLAASARTQVAPALREVESSMTATITKGVAFGTFLEKAFREVAHAAADWAKETVHAAAQLNDLSAATGSSVEALSQITNSFKVSGVGGDALAQALQRLSVGLSGTDEESQRSSKALNLLGVTARDPAEALKQLAQTLDQYADGANKAAIVQAALGRGAERLLPALKDLAAQHDLVASVTAEQANQANELERSMRQLSVRSGELARSLLSTLVPALNEIIARFSAAKQGGLDFYDSFVVAFQNSAATQRDIRNIVTSIGEYQKAIDTINDGKRRGIVTDEELRSLPGYVQQIDQLTAKLKALYAARDASIRANVAGLGFTGDARDLALAQKPDAPVVPGRSGGREKVDEVTRALEQMQAQLQRTLAAEDKLTEVDKVFVALADGKINAIGRENKARVDAILGIAAEIDAKKRAEAAQKTYLQGMGDIAEALNKEYAIRIKNAELSNKAFDEFFDQEEKRRLAIDDGIRSLREEVEQAEFELRIMGLSNAERIKEIALRNAQKAGIDTTKISLDALIERMQAASAAQQAIKEDVGIWNSLADGAANFAGNLTKGVGSAFDSIRNSLRQFATDLIALFAKKFVLNIGASLLAGTGAGSALAQQAGQLGQGTVGGSLLNSIGNPFGSGFSLSGNTWGGAGGEGFNWGGVAGGAGIGFGVGSASAALFGNSRNQTGISVGGTVGGAIGSLFGPIGTLVGSAIGSAIGSLFKSGGGPKEGGFAASSGLGIDRYFTPNARDSDLSKVVDTITGSYTSALRTLGGTGTAKFALGYDTDPNGTAPNRISSGVFVNGQQIAGERDRAVGRDPAQLQNEITLTAKRSLLSALQASDLPDLIKKVVGSLAPSSASTDAIDKLLTLAQAFKTASEAASGDVVADALKAYTDSQLSATQVVATLRGRVESLSASFDGSLESTTALTQATIDYRQAVGQVLIAIKQIADQSKALFADTRTQLQTIGLSGTDLYGFYKGKADDVLEQIATETDPVKVGQLTQLFNQYLTSAVSALNPEDQLANKNPLIAWVDAADAFVQERLGALFGDVSAGANDPFQAVNAALDDAATRMGSAADTQANAAGQMQAAAVSMNNAAAGMNAAAAALANARITAVVAGPAPVNG